MSVGVQELIEFMMELKREKPEKEKMIEGIVEILAESDPKCNYCKWWFETHWMSECKHPKHDKFDGIYGYFCPDFELKSIYEKRKGGNKMDEKKRMVGKKKLGELGGALVEEADERC